MTQQTKQQVEYSAMVSAEQAADYFESVAAGIRQHAMLIESGNDSIELDVGQMMKLDAEFHINEKKSSIEFELSWRKAAGQAIEPALHVLTAEDFAEREAYGDDVPSFGPTSERGVSRASDLRAHDVDTDGAQADRADEHTVAAPRRTASRPKAKRAASSAASTKRPRRTSKK